MASARRPHARAAPLRTYFINHALDLLTHLNLRRFTPQVFVVNTALAKLFHQREMQRAGGSGEGAFFIKHGGPIIHRWLTFSMSRLFSRLQWCSSQTSRSFIGLPSTSAITIRMLCSSSPRAPSNMCWPWPTCPRNNVRRDWVHAPRRACLLTGSSPLMLPCTVKAAAESSTTTSSSQKEVRRGVVLCSHELRMEREF